MKRSELRKLNQAKKRNATIGKTIMFSGLSALLVAPVALSAISVLADEISPKVQDVAIDGGTVEETPVVQAQVQDVQIEYPEEVVEAQEIATQEAVYTEQAQAQVAKVQAAPKASQTFYGSINWTQDQEDSVYVTFSNGETAEVYSRGDYLEVYFPQTGVGVSTGFDQSVAGTRTETLDYTETGNTYVLTVTVTASQEPEIPTEAKAPTNISYDGEYLYAVGSDGDKMMAYDASGNSISYYAFGEGGNSQSTFDLKRPLKSGEKIYVVAYDSYGNTSAPTWFTNETIKEVSNRVIGLDVDSGTELYSTTEKGLPGTTKTVTAQTVEDYNLVGDKTQTLTFGENGDVVFQYKKKDTTPEPVKTTKLTVKYLDGDKKEIATSTVTTEESGKEISVTAKDIKGYTLVGDKTVNVTPTGDTQTVTFSYTKDAVTPDPVKKTKLTVKYVDDANKSLATETVSEVETGKETSVTAKEIVGYTVKGEKTIQVTPTDATQIVVFTYIKDEVTPEPIKKTKLTVEYLEQLSLKELAEPVVSEVETGKSVTVKAKEIKGYTIVGQSEYTITPDSDTHKITFIYVKDAEVPTVIANATEVSFVKDSDGKQIQANVPSGLQLVIVKNGEIIGESVAKTSKSVNTVVTLTEQVKAGESVDYYTRDAKGNTSVMAVLTREKATDPVTPVDPKPTDPVTPVDPKPTDPVTPVDPKPTEPTTPVEPKPTEPTKPVVPTTPTDSGNGAVTPTTPTDSGNGKVTGTSTDTTTKNNATTNSNATAKNESDKKEIPQLGEASGFLTSIGIGIVALMSFVLFKRKKATK